MPLERENRAPAGLLHRGPGRVPDGLVATKRQAHHKGQLSEEAKMRYSEMETNPAYEHSDEDSMVDFTAVSSEQSPDVTMGDARESASSGVGGGSPIKLLEC